MTTTTTAHPARRTARLATAGATALPLLAATAALAEPAPGSGGIGDPYYPAYGNGGYDAQIHGGVRMAIATARRLGAVVEGYDVRPAVKEQVMSLGAKFLEIPLGAGRQAGPARPQRRDDDREGDLHRHP